MREVDPCRFPAGLHKSCHVLSVKGSVMNTTKNTMNLKPRFYVTLRGIQLLYTFCTVPQGHDCIQITPGLSWKKNSREHLECWVLRELVMGPCKNSELQVLYKKIFMFHLSCKLRIFVWEKFDKPRVFHLRFIWHFNVLWGRKVWFKLLSAINKHIFHTHTYK